MNAVTGNWHRKDEKVKMPFCRQPELETDNGWRAAGSDVDGGKA